MTFTALSVIQPGPFLILRPDVRDPAARLALRGARRLQDCENRDWETPFRGWALLHASSERPAKWDYQEAALFAAKRGVELPLRDNVFYGGVVGAVRVDECTWSHRSPWFRLQRGKRCFVFGASVPFDRPVMCDGRPRFFSLPLPGSGAGGAELLLELTAAVRRAGLAAAFGLEPALAISPTALVDREDFQLR